MVQYKFGIRKVVGLGTDGASVMASEMNGVNGLLTKDNPHLIFMYCVHHRLNLAVLQSSSDRARRGGIRVRCLLTSSAVGRGLEGANV